MADVGHELSAIKFVVVSGVRQQFKEFPQLQISIESIKSQGSSAEIHVARHGADLWFTSINFHIPTRCFSFSTTTFPSSHPLEMFSLLTLTAMKFSWFFSRSSSSHLFSYRGLTSRSVFAFSTMSPIAIQSPQMIIMEGKSEFFHEFWISIVKWKIRVRILINCHKLSLLKAQKKKSWLMKIIKFKMNINLMIWHGSLQFYLTIFHSVTLPLPKSPTQFFDENNEKVCDKSDLSETHARRAKMSHILLKLDYRLRTFALNSIDFHSLNIFPEE